MLLLPNFTFPFIFGHLSSNWERERERTKDQGVLNSLQLAPVCTILHHQELWHELEINHASTAVKAPPCMWLLLLFSLWQWLWEMEGGRCPCSQVKRPEGRELEMPCGSQDCCARAQLSCREHWYVQTSGLRIMPMLRDIICLVHNKGYQNGEVITFFLYQSQWKTIHLLMF